MNNAGIKKTNIVLSILAIIVGLLILIIPGQCFKAIVILIGLASIANGIFNVVKVRTLIANPEYHMLITIRAFVSIIVGLLAVLLPAIFTKTASGIWTVMMYCLAVYLVITSAMELYAITKLKNSGIATKPYVSEILASLIMAVILFIVPAKIGEIIVRIIGALVMLLGVAFLVVELKSRPLVVYSEEVPNVASENPENSDGEFGAEKDEK
ncbi:MAG: DUF308 domain-containing protein [Treponemataceae bacterium]